MEPSCPFCNIDSEKNIILMKTDGVVVVLSNKRLMPGHTLVIPKRHVSALSQLIKWERDELFKIAIRFQEKLKALSPGGGCDLSQHDRPFMPTTELSIPQHLHIHLRPRTWCNEFYERVLKQETDMFQALSVEEMEAFQKLLAE